MAASSCILMPARRLELAQQQRCQSLRWAVVSCSSLRRGQRLVAPADMNEDGKYFKEIGYSDASDDPYAEEAEETVQSSSENIEKRFDNVRSARGLLQKLRTRHLNSTKKIAAFTAGTPARISVDNREHARRAYHKDPVGYDVKQPRSGEYRKREVRIAAPRTRTPTSITVHNRGEHASRASENDPVGSEKHRLNEEDLRLQDAFFSRKSFKKLGASLEVIEALSSLGIVKPSEIQALAFRHVLKGSCCIIADQTGSGKTLAYLAPLLQRLREDEEQGNFSIPKNPRVLVLAPTSELALQVSSVCRSLAKTCPIKSIVATGGFKWKTQAENLERGPDVLVATPGRFLHHLKEGTLQLNKLQSVVLDEVDVLLGEEEYFEAMQNIAQMAPMQLQYVHVTATLPADVHAKLTRKHPDSVSVLGPNLHLTASGLNEVLVDCSGEDDAEKTPETAFANKKTELLKLVQEKQVSKTIVFCNKIDTCRKVENVLNRYDRGGRQIRVLPYHAALSQELRLQNMATFLKATETDVSAFLVCTDRASRGLDSVGVENVILFDFPRDPSEYIRRVGRTARAGGAGKVYVFVVGKQVSLARRIIARNEKRHPVHVVPEP